MHAVRYVRPIEYTRAYRPRSLITLGGGTHGITPSVRRVIEGARVDRRPVQEIIARVMCVLVVVEDIDDAELTHGEHPPVGVPRTAELIANRFDGFLFTALVNGLAHKRTRQPKVRVVRADFIGFSAGKGGNAPGVVETKTLI